MLWCKENEGVIEQRDQKDMPVSFFFVWYELPGFS